MEGFLNIRLPAWMRRLITRMIAIVPAAAVTLLYGESGTGKLLIFSQVVLALQLPFAVIPLVMFTRDRSKLGAFTAPVWLSTTCIAIAVILVTLNAKVIYDFVTG